MGLKRGLLFVRFLLSLFLFCWLCTIVVRFLGWCLARLIAVFAFSKNDRRLLQVLANLAFCNPLSENRIEMEKEFLGAEFEQEKAVAWGRAIGPEIQVRKNVAQITQASFGLIDQFRSALDAGSRGTDDRLMEDYWSGVHYLLFYKNIATNHIQDFFKAMPVKVIWQQFLADYNHYSSVVDRRKVKVCPAEHLFACLVQVYRAFYSIFDNLVGDSLPMVELRANVWTSIFSVDLKLYQSSLYQTMGRLPSLVTGPSGTGKELVARAIGLSQYMEFCGKKEQFLDCQQDVFHPLNLSAMTPTLIESELFGHAKGAFTGATSTNDGWLHRCLPHGAIMLDEIGELDLALQVKLLRVVQQRTYSRLGENKERTFVGKIIGATNRDLVLEMEEGRFREDLYYRLCADRIQTPSLRQQFDACPDDLITLTNIIASKLAGDQAESLCERAVDWINNNLGDDYPWRGNFRELEQCVSSIMIRSQYVPAVSFGKLESGRWKGEKSETLSIPIETNFERSHLDSCQDGPGFVSQINWLKPVGVCGLTAEELLSRYCTWSYFKNGSYESAAKKIGIDRRTLKSKIDPDFLDQLYREKYQADSV